MKKNTNAVQRSAQAQAQGGDLPEAVQLLFCFMETLNPQLSRLMHQISLLAHQVGRQMGLDADLSRQVEIAAMIHDVGLLDLPKDVQNKEVKLMTEEQYRLFCEHPVTASITLEKVEPLAGLSEMVLHHHEFRNGKGFPAGLSGGEIPIGSRILLVAGDYCHIIATWPRDMRKLVSHARRYLSSEDLKSFAINDDPETIIVEAAERLMIKDPEEKYDPKVVKALMHVIHREKNIAPTEMVALNKLKTGMVLMDDLRLKGGRLLITRGTTLDPASVQSLQRLAEREMIPQQLYVSLPRKSR